MRKDLFVLVFLATLQGFSLAPVDRKPLDMFKRLSLMVNTRNARKREAPPIAQLFQNIDVKQVRNITTVALLVGAVSVQHRMDKHMKKKLEETQENLEKRSLAQNKVLFEEIEKIMYRNTRSLLTLAKVIVTGSQTIKNSNNLADNERLRESTLGQLIDFVDQKSLKPTNTSLDHLIDQEDVVNYLTDLTKRINDHLGALKRITDLMTNEVVEIFRPKKQTKPKPLDKPEKLILQEGKKPANSVSSAKPTTTTTSKPTTTSPNLLPLSSFSDFSTVSAADVYAQYINKLPTMIARPSLMRIDHQQFQQLHQQQQTAPQMMPPALTTGFGVFYQIPLFFDTEMVATAVSF